jgi:hypothetical protein
MRDSVCGNYVSRQAIYALSCERYFAFIISDYS